MRASFLVALGLAAYVAGLLVLFPAAYAVAQLEPALRGRVVMAEPAGTVWNGSARVGIMARGGPGLALDRVEWRFLPLRLFAGEAAYEARIASPSLAGTLHLARAIGGWRLRDVRLQGDASAVAAIVPVFAVWRPAGPVTLTAPHLAFDGREARGELAAEWRGAVTALSPVRPLGSYRATWRTEGGPARIGVETLEGPLRITGSGTFVPPAQLAFSGTARGEGASAAALEPLLDLMGPRRPDGARALEMRLR